MHSAKMSSARSLSAKLDPCTPRADSIQERNTKSWITGDASRSKLVPEEEGERTGRDRREARELSRRSRSHFIKRSGDGG